MPSLMFVRLAVSEVLKQTGRTALYLFDVMAFRSDFFHGRISVHKSESQSKFLRDADSSYKWTETGVEETTNKDLAVERGHVRISNVRFRENGC